VRRFRPNIVVATGPEEQGFVENDWIGRTISIGDEVRLRVSGPCPRCIMIKFAQGDLPKDSGILRAAILRTAAQNNHANVGVHADVVKGGTVRRGDHVKLIKSCQRQGSTSSSRRRGPGASVVNQFMARIGSGLI
jgi:uncharacterized protein YcbX